ncbi:MAG: Chemotaxis response regulator protein-glutamate methylesterase [Candidatus Scalindua rubra]|uniref:Chemotaxis response regulator protein-glutamate methylesterase n=1 Tax=Candidatus Scalindua rubra TaxID=1872076 RepID=A0A1E3X9P9_9BACT|nr:MAG: Chemotaxis response regulator protein-glutamate methylesterase [Candidatus Scalindua rubra]
MLIVDRDRETVTTLKGVLKEKYDIIVAPVVMITDDALFLTKKYQPDIVCTEHFPGAARRKTDVTTLYKELLTAKTVILPIDKQIKKNLLEKSKPKVLIIEDNSFPFKNMGNILRDQGYEIVNDHIINTTEEAFRLVKKYNPDIILLDHNIGKEQKEEGLTIAKKLAGVLGTARRKNTINRSSRSID